MVANGQTGLLAPPGDVAGLAVALGSLLDDGPRRRALAEAARQRARALFSAEAVVPRYEELYERVIAAPAAPIPH